MFMVGCGKPSTSEASPEVGHIRNVMLLGREYYAAHKSKAPKNIGELREWAMKEKGAQEEDFKSTRDGEEYLIGPGMMGGVLVFEATGKGGMRYGTNPGGAVSEYSDENIQGFLKGQQSKQATRGKVGSDDNIKKKGN
jgi:hypothetical protein